MKFKLFSTFAALQTLLSFALYFASIYCDFQKYGTIFKLIYGFITLIIIYNAIKELSKIFPYSLTKYSLFGSSILLFSDLIFQPIKVFFIENYSTNYAIYELYLSLLSMTLASFCFSIPISFYIKEKSKLKTFIIFLALSMLFNFVRTRYLL